MERYESILWPNHSLISHYLNYIMARPDLLEVPVFYHNYVNQVQEDNVAEAIQKNGERALSFFRTIPSGKWDYRYAEGKWTNGPLHGYVYFLKNAGTNDWPGLLRRGDVFIWFCFFWGLPKEMNSAATAGESI